MSLASASVAAVLALDRVTVGYDGPPVLAPLSLAIDTPSLVAVVGPNGAGKSTLLKLVTGVLTPWSGRVRVLGDSVDAARRAGAMAYMPQQEQLDWDFPLTVGDVVMSGRLAAIRLRGGWRSRLPLVWQPKIDRQAAQTALAAVDMADLAHRPIGALSGGQKKRVLLARALAQDARLLVLDEPLAGVDQASEAVIRGLLIRERQRGRTVLMVTHDLDGLAGFADRALVIHGGLVADGPPDSVFDDRTLSRARVAGLAAALQPQSAPPTPQQPQALDREEAVVG